MDEDNEPQQDVDFSISRRSAMSGMGVSRKAPQQTTVDFVDFANSKPTFQARKRKVQIKAGTLVDSSSFDVKRKVVGTVAVKKAIFEDSDEDDWRKPSTFAKIWDKLPQKTINL